MGKLFRNPQPAAGPAPAPAAKKEKQPGVPRDFYYAGRRLGTGNKLLDAIYVIDEKGKLAEKANHYPADRRERIVGGRYTGARFDTGSCYGYKVSKYAGAVIDDKALRIEWEAASTFAKSERDNIRLEADAKRREAIATIMKPLAEQYRAMYTRGDYDGARGLRIAVELALIKGGAL